MKNSEELKLCPFCGGEANTLHVVHHYMVTCTECFASIGLLDDENKAKELWNRRVNNDR